MSEDLFKLFPGDGRFPGYFTPDSLLRHRFILHAGIELKKLKKKIPDLPRLRHRRSVRPRNEIHLRVRRKSKRCATKPECSMYDFDEKTSSAYCISMKGQGVGEGFCKA